MRTCPTCGSPTTPDLRFCLNCGTALAERCSACDTPRAAGARFCGTCGSRFPDGAIGTEGVHDPLPSARASATGVDRAGPLQLERRLVSVLFADLVGFTTQAEGTDPEEVRNFLTRYFDAASQVMARYGGTIEKFIGDAVMAVWGTPVAFEDDAERAVRAALDLVEAVRGLGPVGAGGAAVGIDVRAAVMSGDAAVTVGASGQGMVAGDLVNACSRLQGVADPGTVLVDEATLRGARNAVAFEPAGEQNLRGKVLPVPAWRALRVVAERGGLGRSEGLEAPFVGRDEELRLLKEQLHTTGREGRARLVTIFGQPGMGKSRLVWEFQKYVDGVMEDIYWHQGRSPSYGEGIAYWALGEMVRRRAGINESEDSQSALRKLHAAISRWISEEADREWIAGRLAPLLGLADAPTGDREELFAAWRRFFEGVASAGTTVMVFEDLHWADQGLLDFIESLLEWSRSKPILVIGLARPDLLERRPAWGTVGRASVALHLEPVGADRMTDLLGGLAPGLPPRAIAHIAERSEGVPLYAVETVRMLLDEGRLVRDGERFRLVDEATPFAVPPSLHALIAARLDALQPEERAVIQDAAVIGKSFTVASVAAVGGQNDVSVTEARLRVLMRKELIEQDIDPRSPERGNYQFVHGLFREIAYGTLSRRDRRTRHLAAARHFEQLDDEELTGVLASHYVDAYRAAPEGPEGEAVAAQARVALRAAVDRSLALHAHVTALDYIEQALSVTTDERERAALWLRAAEPADIANGPKAGEEYLRKALSYYERVDDLRGMERTTIALSQVLLPHARIDEAVAALEAMAARLPEMTDRLDAQLCNELARAYCFVSRAEDAFKATERGLTVAERLGIEAEIADLFITKAWVMDLLGRAREAAVVSEGGLMFATRAGSTSSQVRSRMNLSNWQMTDDPKRGVDTAWGGVEIARRAGHHAWVTRIAGNWAACSALIGQWHEVLDVLGELDVDSLDVSTEVGTYGAAAFAEAMLGIDAGWLPKFEAVRDRAASSASYQDRAGYLGFELMVAWARGDDDGVTSIVSSAHEMPIVSETMLGSVMATRSAFAVGRPQDVALVTEMLDRRGDTGSWLTAARRHLAGLALRHAGDGARAEAAMRDALTAFRRLDVAPDVAVALIDLRQILGPEHPDSPRLVAEAEAILDRLGAQSLSRRLDRVLAADAGGAGTLARPAAARRGPPQGVAARTPSG